MTRTSSAEAETYFIPDPNLSNEMPIDVIDTQFRRINGLLTLLQTSYDFEEDEFPTADKYLLDSIDAIHGEIHLLRAMVKQENLLIKERS